ncbi:hypothetical protein PhCBS80983_g04312 [Powellomyces hirtus]|uniref:FMN hydroxy acid dehydrogenase domain-containing protein n=1 Tax=Powellomyces hirtus TaxID=109895 RepID=A0A507E0W7_9FUNG|nr:hypothetical protein PhCBS80983_g04312 [Powellomyces hirtus]
MKPAAWNYYSSGSDDEISLRENSNAYARVWLIPRVLVDVSRIDFSTTILGHPSSAPFYMTATALGRLGHPDGELALTRAAGNHGVIHMLPSLSSCSLDEMTGARCEGQTQFLQLYVNRDRETTRRMIKQAEEKGCKALFITADAPPVAKRVRSKHRRSSGSVKITGRPPLERQCKDYRKAAARAAVQRLQEGHTLCQSTRSQCWGQK